MVGVPEVGLVPASALVLVSVLVLVPASALVLGLEAGVREWGHVPERVLKPHSHS